MSTREIAIKFKPIIKSLSYTGGKCPIVRDDPPKNEILDIKTIPSKTEED